MERSPGFFLHLEFFVPKGGRSLITESFSEEMLLLLILLVLSLREEQLLLLSEEEMLETDEFSKSGLAPHGGQYQGSSVSPNSL